MGPKPTKAYRNQDFLTSREGRAIRIQCELAETEQRIHAAGIEGTILFFGSARSKTKAQHDAQLAEMKAKNEDTSRLEKIAWMCDVHEKVTELSRKVATFLAQEQWRSIGILTGGGPGMMEAANEGAYSVDKNRSMGMGISLPFEPSLNPYVSPELAFEFHYFFTRKFWMVLQTTALVVAPGGVGTMDELFEVMTLQQCGKIKVKFPIILFGKHYWDNVINWQFMADSGTVNQSDVDQLVITDDVDFAYQKIVEGLQEQLANGTLHGPVTNNSDKRFY
jgi:uncharacterized protein (TIGR00730 family)